MHRLVEHTGEVELELEGPTLAALFLEGAHGLTALLEVESGKPATRTVRAEAPDRATLLVEWLNELVFLAETDGFVPERVEELDLAERSLRATVAGLLAAPPHLVKAVTYHGLVVEERGGVWYGRVVLDV